MPLLIARRSVVVQRDGKNITVLPGQKFDFSPDEARYLEKHAPNHTRSPRNEAPETVMKDLAGPTDKTAEELDSLKVKQNVVTATDQNGPKKANATVGRPGQIDTSDL